MPKQKSASSPPPPPIHKMISPERLEELRASYRSADGQGERDEILQGTLHKIYGRAEAYTDSIYEIFYGELPSDTARSREHLSEEDRERLVIALLASQGGEGTLAIHIYLGLMVGLSPNEIGHILLLAGVYTGVNRFAEAMFVTIRTLGILTKSKTTNPLAIRDALIAEFMLGGKK